MLSVSERTFNQAVLESPQPVLVHFCAPWCSLCRLIEPLLFKFQGETEGRLKLARVNVDANFRLVSRYRLKSLPTLILFEGGAIACRVEAIQGRDDLQQQFLSILNKLKCHGTSSIIEI
jgi:thioredoxin 1